MTPGEAAEQLVDCQGEEGAGFLLGSGVVGMKMSFKSSDRQEKAGAGRIGAASLAGGGGLDASGFVLGE